MLTAAEIAGMRATAELALPDTAVIQRHSTASDGGGGQTTEWGEHLTVACRISPVAGGEAATEGGRIADESTHLVTLPAETDVTEADRLTIRGTSYEVTLVRSRGAWEITRRVEAKEAP